MGSVAWELVATIFFGLNYHCNAPSPTMDKQLGGSIAVLVSALVLCVWETVTACKQWRGEKKAKEAKETEEKGKKEEKKLKEKARLGRRRAQRSTDVEVGD